MSVFRPDLLAGKHAFLTGGSSGINLGIAEKLAEHGAKVRINGRKPEKIEAAVAGIRAKGGVAAGAPADVRDPAALEAQILASVAEWGPIDILVSGAAGNFPAPAVMISPNGFKSVMDIDVLGTFHAARAAFPHLRQPGASVIHVSAPQAFVPMPFQAHVCAAKAGVDMLTRVLAMEWGPAGIRVNSLTPGPIEGTEGMARLAPSDDARKVVLENIPLGRLGRREDIADFALFLCSDAASFVTGAVLVCDGGQSLMGGGALVGGLLRG